MEINLPSDCGNSPRMSIVGELVSSWAKGAADAVGEWLADDVTWSLIGGDTHVGLGSAQTAGPPILAERVEVLSIVTHGRLASCDGYLESGTTRVAFSHVFPFVGVSKTAKIAEIRTFIVEMH